MTLDSILAQSYEDFELLAVDDASQDNTGEIIGKYAGKDARIHHIRNEENLGLSKTLIRAINLSKGKYLARHDAGDLSHPQRFEKQVCCLDEENLDLIGSRTFIIDAEGRETDRFDFALSHRALLLRIPFFNSFCHGSLLIRKTSYDRIGGYRAVYKCSQDYDLIVRLFLNGSKCKNHPEYLYSWRKLSTGISGEKREEQDFFASLAGFPIAVVNRAVQRHSLPLAGRIKYWLSVKINSKSPAYKP